MSTNPRKKDKKDKKDKKKKRPTRRMVRYAPPPLYPPAFSRYAFGQTALPVLQPYGQNYINPYQQNEKILETLNALPGKISNAVGNRASEPLNDSNIPSNVSMLTDSTYQSDDPTYPFYGDPPVSGLPSGTIPNATIPDVAIQGDQSSISLITDPTYLPSLPSGLPFSEGGETFESYDLQNSVSGGYNPFKDPSESGYLGDSSVDSVGIHSNNTLGHKTPFMADMRFDDSSRETSGSGLPRPYAGLTGSFFDLLPTRSSPPPNTVNSQASSFDGFPISPRWKETDMNNYLSSIQDQMPVFRGRYAPEKRSEWLRENHQGY